jgi:hypothetical protein
MRESTMELCKSSVAILENTYSVDNSDESISLKGAIDYCYGYFTEMQEDTGRDKAVRFDGKAKVLKEIEKLIQESEYIKLEQ